MDTAKSTPHFHHVFYKIWMVVELGRIESSSLPTQVLKNAVVESLALHQRGLLDFLYPPQNPRSSDETARSYFSSNFDWDDIRGAIPEDLKKLRDRINHNIAHLTEYQKTPAEGRKPLNKDRIDELISTALKKFYVATKTRPLCDCNKCAKRLTDPAIRSYIGLD